MNTELITALRNCSSPTVGSCTDCPYYKGVSCKWQMMEDAADALEAADKRIAELEAQMPKWTMLKDEMPKPHTKVLVVVNDVEIVGRKMTLEQELFYTPEDVVNILLCQDVVIAAERKDDEQIH